MSRRTALCLAVLLLLATGLLHYGLAPLSQRYADPAAAHRAWFYVGQGANAALLLLVLAWLAPRRLYAVPLALVCLWAAVEQILVAGCRLARGIEQVPSLGLWQGVCSTVAAWPTWVIGVAFGAVAAASILYETGRSNANDRPSSWH